MIYTITLNPSIDYVVQAKNVQLGSLNYADFETKEPGGKGINVSRVLTKLGVENKSWGFLGGFTGDYMENRLNEENLLHDFIRIQKETRINIKLKSTEETEINGVSPAITKEDWDKLLQQLDEVKSGDTIVLAGSVPSSLPKDAYEIIMKKVSDRQVKVALDTKGDVLKKTISNRPFLIKPNQYELEDYFGVTIRSQEELISYGKQLVVEGAQHVIISLAGDGALMIDEENVYAANAPKGKVLNSVGAGDSLVAGFLARYVETKDKLSAFQYGVASGSATAFSIGLCEQDQVEGLVKEIILKKLS